MPKHEFKNVGMKIFESSSGDILLTDPMTKLEAIITSELMDKTDESYKFGMILINQFTKFIRGHRELRKKKLQESIMKIHEINPKKAGFIIRKMEEGNLFRAEREAHFFLQAHKMIERQALAPTEAVERIMIKPKPD